ncbi:MAG: deoxyuridine 5'-triphosphate nucleotidohydrolase [Eubacteriales bacterium]|jgi:dUTP pyrophosphatase|nr:deoxyuridine 5'-triphosphate nucleotidohydrolase [Eubacteriales bacterium]MDD3289602.1 deoxyuridine 5'-triphosphate nucleotidohydrolase [Eubacteriales bacterium]MDD3863828.1 deoxyuridine 5'-triphosphate nucleotidohydrolase [Eubacteriales bacterium]MDD4444271.1 deoxyuridine 5'-triphosphate nucleotidohydrolase [Eubacteriales bacterium]
MRRIAEFEKVSFSTFFEAYGKLDLSADISGAERSYEQIELPLRATEGSAGYDFFLPFSLSLKAGKSCSIPTGIRAKINTGWVLMIYPKSGLGFRYRLQLDNTVGIVDSDYYHADNEGHIIIRITNDSKSEKELSLEAGKAFAQGVFIAFGITHSDAAKGERSGGFGSTGV